ncbi:peroxiredoxin [Rickettsiales bacterium]|nr:peroxiredoxin [Rickettsiales bacterium]
MLEINNKAPDFILTTDENEQISLAGLKGLNIVLYFYPKDDTPGCTKEARNFSDLIEEFKKNDTVIIGVSRDDIASHQKFRKKHDLSIRLASDPEGEVLNKYGILAEKTMFGKKYIGVERSTFLIDKMGLIREAWYKVKVKDHAAEVLKAAVALRTSV